MNPLHQRVSGRAMSKNIMITSDEVAVIDGLLRDEGRRIAYERAAKLHSNERTNDGTESKAG